jgi:transposase
MCELNLNKKKLRELQKVHRKTKDKKLAYRINVIILLAKNYTYEEIYDALLVKERTARRWKKIFKEQGIDGLMEDHYKGGFAKLTIEQRNDLIKHLENNLYSKATEICTYIKKTYNVKYTPDGLVLLLHRLGFSYKKTKLVPGKADSKKQKEFVEEYNKIRKNLKNDEKIYFIDGVHPVHNTMPAYGWIKTGKEKEIRTNTGRQRLNINGAYSPTDNEIIFRNDDSINAQSTIALFKQIEKANPDKNTIYVINDNARYYVSKMVKEYLKNSKIVMIKLPPYSPNLNLIERLWKLLKKNVLYNKYYSNFNEFSIAIFKFLKTKNKSHKNILAHVLKENFHIIQSEMLEV